MDAIVEKRGRFRDCSVRLDGPQTAPSSPNIEDILSVAGVRLGPQTLYGAISRLESCGLIEALAPDHRRNPYRLTGAGERSLRQRLQILAAVARAGEERLASA